MRRLSAIVFTDVVGFTPATQADEAASLARRREQEELIRPLLGKHSGRAVKSLGDGLLLEFESALKAVECAVEIQATLRKRNADHAGEPIELRIGVHVGDVEEENGDVFGDTVNVASRVVRHAEPGDVCLSAAAADLLRSRVPYQLENLGPKMLKGVREPVEIYRVRPPATAIEESTGGSRSPRLAVLPLANISPDPRDEYFADGLTEEIIAVLSQIRELRVIARTSVAQYKAATKSVAQIGKELGVTSVLEGSVRKADHRIRITLQLIDVATQEHIWADSYNRDLDDVFSIQSEIAEKTASALRLQLVGRAKAAVQRAPTSNIEAYDLYLRGVFASRQTTEEGFRSAVRYFEEATRKDPLFSAAFSHWANLYVMSLGEVISMREAAPRAKRLVAEALELDPTASDAHATLGNIALQCDQDWPLAEAEFRKATALNPSDANAYHWYGVLLFVLQRYGEAAEALRRARELDPYWKSSLGWLVLVHMQTGDLSKALALAEEAVAEPPSSRLDRVRLAIVLVRLGRTADALREVERLEFGPSEQGGVYRAAVLAQLGRPEAARLLIDESRAGVGRGYISLSRMAALHAVLGEPEAALAALERDFHEGDRTFWFEYQFSAFDLLRDDPRFVELLRRYHLPTKSERSTSAR